MLFFVHAELKEQPAMTRERYLGLIASTWKTIKEMEDSGKVMAGGAMIGRRAGVVILDVESNEELSDILNKLPLSAYLDWDIVPLIPADRALDSAKWALQHLAPVGVR